MLSANHTALSGLTAFGKKVEVTAHNVANVNTDGFKKLQTDFIEVPVGGVEATVRQDDSPGALVLKDTPPGPAQVDVSHTDLGQEAVNLIVSQRGLEANLTMLRTADQVLGTVLDIRK